MSDPNGPILIGFLLYGIFGAAGQIIRAVTALGGSQTLASGSANQQSLFNAAYFLVTLIIGFVAGLLAGLVAFDTITQTITIKTALAAMAAGYAGADFIEKTLPALPAAFGVGGGTTQGQRAQPGAPPGQAAIQAAARSGAPDVGLAEAAARQRVSDVENRVSRLEAATASGPVPAVTTQGNSAAQTTIDMVCKMFPATPRAPIARNLPFVLDGLAWRGLTDKEMVCVALATIRAETEGFVPISEFVSSSNTTTNPFDNYDPGTKIGEKLGNVQPGDGGRFCGRGFVQLTGRSNYTHVGNEIHINLSASPALAGDPATAGKILAQFLYDHEKTIRTALAQNDLAAARKAVNGGTNGLSRFESAYQTGQDVIPA